MVVHGHQSSLIIIAVQSWSGDIKACTIKTTLKCGCGRSPITLELVFFGRKSLNKEFLQFI